MVRLIYWIISFCLLLGVGDALVGVTRDMLSASVHAHQHDQLSYAKFTRLLLGAKAKPRHKS